MASFEIQCPECDKEITAPEEAVGRKIRCKGCDHVFVVKKPKAPKGKGKEVTKEPPPAKKSGKGKEPPKPPPAKAKPAGLDDDEGPEAYGLQGFSQAPRCPNCANEMEDDEAIVCLHCGYNTQTREQATRRKVRHITGGDKFLWILPGILAIIAVFLMIGYCALHHWVIPPMIFDEWDKLYAETEGDRFEVIDKLTGYCCIEYLFHPATELWMVIFTVFLCYLCIKFAIRRLIYNNTPPEVEEK